MQIGLVGAPQSGKTDLANALGETYFEGRVNGCIDKYVERLRDQTGWAFGHYGGYLANSLVAFERIRLEQLFKEDTGIRDLITCGTLVDSITYTAMNMQVTTHPVAPNGTNDLARLSNTMHFLGMVFSDTFPLAYDRVLFLRTASEDSLDIELDNQIESALTTFNVPYQDVGQPNADQLASALVYLYAEDGSDAQAA